jgi:predicted kinase
VVYQGPIPEIWLVTGTPGTAWSAIARALAGRLERAAHIEGDAIWRQIVAGRVEPGAPLEGEAERQYELTVRNQCLLARSYAEAGFVPVLDFAIPTHHQLDAYRNYLLGGHLHLVVIERGVEPGERGDLADTGLWLDAGALDPGSAARAILERREEAVLR